MDGVVEIITGRERRRRWSLQDKLRLVAETHEPGAAVGAVAARHDVCESLLYAWRRQVRGGVLTAAPEMSVFLPVHMVDTVPMATPASAPAVSRSTSANGPAAPSGLIEIDLGNGQHVRVDSDVNLAALRRVLAALRT